MYTFKLILLVEQEEKITLSLFAKIMHRLEKDEHATHQQAINMNHLL